jgi:hypothetical protein
MNLEEFFVRTADHDALCALIMDHFKSRSDTPGKQFDWGLHLSDDGFPGSDGKRRVVVSPVEAGWVCCVESKEVLDFALLNSIATGMGTSVLAVLISDSTGICGYAHCRNGVLEESFWSEDEPDLLQTVRSFLRRHGVPQDVTAFREAIPLLEAGWKMLKAS